MPGELDTPTSPLYRLARKPGALEWPDWNRVGSGRFDDPKSPPQYRVLYVGDRRACFCEKLAPFRPDREGIVSRSITESWIESRVIARFMLRDPEQRWRWLDLRSPTTFSDFRSRFGHLLDEFGYRDFDLSAAASDERNLTRPIALWAFENGYHGIRYPTRHDPDGNCWAIFSVTNPAQFINVEIARLKADDEDLAAVATAWGLRLPET